MRTSCVRDIENICEFYGILWNVECEAKKLMLVICSEMLNIEWGQIDPKGNRRVKKQWVAVKCLGSNKDTWSRNYGQSGDRTRYLVVTGRPLSPWLTADAQREAVSVKITHRSLYAPCIEHRAWTSFTGVQRDTACFSQEATHFHGLTLPTSDICAVESPNTNKTEWKGEQSQIKSKRPHCK